MTEEKITEMLLMNESLAEDVRAARIISGLFQGQL